MIFIAFLFLFMFLIFYVFTSRFDIFTFLHYHFKQTEIKICFTIKIEKGGKQGWHAG